MKTEQRLRQNQKVYRHGANKTRMSMIRQRASKVLGKLLPALPGVPKLLEDIREQFNIPEVSPGENIEEQLAPGDEINWMKVRRELELRLRAMPDILPKELAAFQKMIEFKKTLPRKPKFNVSGAPLDATQEVCSGH